MRHLFGMMIPFSFSIFACETNPLESTTLHVYHGCYYIPSIYLGCEYTDPWTSSSDIPTLQPPLGPVIVKQLGQNFLD